MLKLPPSCQVNRIVPKNSFDKYLSPKQKRLLSTNVEKIKWTCKLSTQTTLLESKEVSEIQIFEILLKKKLGFEEVLDLIDRYIPYPIIFEVRNGDETLYSAAQKHTNPTSTDNAVVDWRFNSDWFTAAESTFQLNLKKSLDDVFADFCLQIAGKQVFQNKSLQEIISIEQKRKKLNTEINKLKLEIKSCKQFNKKVELNGMLNKKEEELLGLV